MKASIAQWDERGREEDMIKRRKKSVICSDEELIWQNLAATAKQLRCQTDGLTYKNQASKKESRELLE